MTIEARIHAYLDGEIGGDDLSPLERVSLQEVGRAIGMAVAVVRREPPPELGAEVMRRVCGLPPRSFRAAREPRKSWAVWRWLFRPRLIVFRIRPLVAVASTVLCVGLVAVLAGEDGGRGAPEVLEEHGVAAPVLVQFRLEAPGARVVHLAGSFSGWSADVALRESEPGIWTARLTLPPGVHDYLFLVDGVRWVLDPIAPAVDDAFGGTNSRLLLSAPALSL